MPIHQTLKLHPGSYKQGMWIDPRGLPVSPIASNDSSSAASEEGLRRKMKYGGHGCCVQSTLNYYYHKNFFRTESTQTQFLSEPQQDPHTNQGYKQSGHQGGLATAEHERSSTMEAIDNNIVATSARCIFLAL